MVYRINRSDFSSSTSATSQQTSKQLEQTQLLFDYSKFLISLHFPAFCSSEDCLCQQIERKNPHNNFSRVIHCVYINVYTCFIASQSFIDNILVLFQLYMYKSVLKLRIKLALISRSRNSICGNLSGLKNMCLVMLLMCLLLHKLNCIDIKPSFSLKSLIKNTKMLPYIKNKKK